MRRPTVVVVGAGASGMAAAIAAASSGASVCLLEAGAKPGRSIMASGNGRCNFANEHVCPQAYNVPGFVSDVMGSGPLEDITRFFDDLGLWYVVEDEGRMYPRSRYAASVLDVLTARLDALGVEVRTGRRVLSVARDARGGGWRVALEDGETLACDAVVWAAGGGTCADLLRGLDRRHVVVDERPGLCPLATSPKPPKELDGVRVQCAVAYLPARGGRGGSGEGCAGKWTAGEVLFRPYGVSGIVVFDLSRFARPGDALAIDLFPDCAEDELARALAARAEKRGCGGELVSGKVPAGFFDGMLHPKLGKALGDLAVRAAGGGASRVSTSGPQYLAHLLKNLTFDVVGPADTAHAQVTLGGLDVGEVDPRTLGVREEEGLFACGEVLDVDGRCGGYNLSWAWLSGLRAGAAASDYAKGVAGDRG